jgi:hypothetical protein
MASDKKICRGYIKNIVLSIIATVLLTLLIWASIPPGLAKPSGLLLEVVGDSFQMDESLQGNVTLQFTLRAENPTSCNITYTNISGTLAVLNEHGEKEGHFLRFNVRDFDVQQQAFVESPNQVTSQLLLTISPTFQGYLLTLHHYRILWFRSL